MQASDIERFEKFIAINPTTGCHIWRGSINNKGYGQFSFGGKNKNVLAHRWIFEQSRNRKIQDGFQIDHNCARPCCVNPEHLEEVSPEVNVLRAAQYARLEQYNIKKHYCEHQPKGSCLECVVRRKVQKAISAKARIASNVSSSPQAYATTECAESEAA